MGKRQHQKDKMYITCAEYTHFYGGKKPDVPQTNFRRLPFDHCSLSLQPFAYPVCTPEGVVFDLLNIVPWLKKYGTNPSNGEKLDGRSLIKLNFAKNSEGKYHCPVLFTVFTNNSHIVAIRTTGNVYAHEAVEQLNIKAKNFRDLLTDEPFCRQDIITLQDPTNLDKFNVSNFFHVKNNMKIIDPDEEKAKQDPSYYLKNTNTETRETLQELYKEFRGDEVLAATMRVPEKAKVDKLNAAHYSTGRVSASFTSTAMVPETTHEAAAIDEDELRYRFVKKKGYVRLHTSLGDLNLELHCDSTPKTCENFIRLCKKQYYDGTIFHRSIRNFVVSADAGCPVLMCGVLPTVGVLTPGPQGPSRAPAQLATSSLWGDPGDPIVPSSSWRCRQAGGAHGGAPHRRALPADPGRRPDGHGRRRGVVLGEALQRRVPAQSLAHGPRSAQHGQLGAQHQQVSVEEIRIDSTVVFVDPYEEADAQIAEERRKTRLEAVAPENMAKSSQPPQGSQGPQTYRQGVGKYISPAVTKRVAEEEPSTSAAVPGAKKKPSRGFGDFSSW
uniref:RING-type E3 ubiquitin transferase n=1 Tax=Moschus moschiferus TaxID=68415 RepID=A0A8C6DH95_MOSMO